MYIGSVIKKYRKEMGLTQTEMANRLGVTTPAVNKWENGNSNPDIELLTPIARLLNISLDTLLSFEEKLTDDEIGQIIRQMEKMFAKDGYHKTYEWALKIVRKYPNCNMLIWSVAVMLDAGRIAGACEKPEQYDEQINAWYERALSDKNEKVQHHAADSLFGFYLRKKNYAMAEKYLNYFSDYDSMKKIYLGRLYKEQGKSEEAYKMFENVIFSEYTNLNFAFSMMMKLALAENDTEYAEFLEEKMKNLSAILDMGKYNEWSCLLENVCARKNVEDTFKVAEQLLESVDSIDDCRKSKLYRHLTLRKADDSYIQTIKEKLVEGFEDDEEFAYMKGYEPWEKLIRKYRGRADVK